MSLDVSQIIGLIGWGAAFSPSESQIISVKLVLTSNWKDGMEAQITLVYMLISLFI